MRLGYAGGVIVEAGIKLVVFVKLGFKRLYLPRALRCGLIFFLRDFLDLRLHRFGLHLRVYRSVDGCFSRVVIGQRGICILINTLSLQHLSQHLLAHCGLHLHLNFIPADTHAAGKRIEHLAVVFNGEVGSHAFVYAGGAKLLCRGGKQAVEYLLGAAVELRVV